MNKQLLTAHQYEDNSGRKHHVSKGANRKTKKCEAPDHLKHPYLVAAREFESFTDSQIATQSTYVHETTITNGGKYGMVLFLETDTVEATPNLINVIYVINLFLLTFSLIRSYFSLIRFSCPVN